MDVKNTLIQVFTCSKFLAHVSALAIHRDPSDLISKGAAQGHHSWMHRWRFSNLHLHGITWGRATQRFLRSDILLVLFTLENGLQLEQHDAVYARLIGQKLPLCHVSALCTFFTATLVAMDKCVALIGGHFGLKILPGCSSQRSQVSASRPRLSLAR